MPRIRIRDLALASLVVVVGSVAGATTIQYSVVDLPDLEVGEDLWQYTYLVSDFDFDQDFGFSVVFSLGLYAELESPPPSAGADWDVLTLQPDPGLPDDGLYDALSLADDASLATPFTIDFVYLGTGTPGSQPFVVYGPGFTPIETGVTSALPEPTTAVSSLIAGVALLAARQRRRPSPGAPTAPR